MSNEKHLLSKVINSESKTKLQVSQKDGRGVSFLNKISSYCTLQVSKVKLWRSESMFRQPSAAEQFFRCESKQKKKQKKFLEISEPFTFHRISSDLSDPCSHLKVWSFAGLQCSVVTFHSSESHCDHVYVYTTTLLDNCTANTKVFAAKLSHLIWTQSNDYTRSAR